MDNIVKYFEGEKVQCIIGVIISVICITASVYFLYSGKTHLKGIAYAFLPLSLFLIIICASVIARTSSDIERVGSYFNDEPAKIQAEEIPRMEKVMRNFSIIKKVELGILLVGIILAIAFWNNDLVKGIAIGLIIQGVILYLFDHFAEARGEPYIEFLKSLK